MALNIQSCQDNIGNTYTNCFGIVETAGTSANLAVWEDHTMAAPVNFAGLGGVYQVTEGNEEADTITALAAVGVTATIIEE